ncbi:MAG: SDR family oxidoreductase [Myxococcales bacterium]|nr:MAG: SDR family oxidoreductase [Myxococcales bacterium]
MDLHLAGKAAIITGGASGLGYATAEYMRREGVNLLLADSNEDNLASARDSLITDGSEAGVETFAVDVRSFSACRAMVAAAIGAFGRVDILVNSAGVGGPIKYFADSAPEDWQDLVAVNLMGVMNCCRAVTDTMIEHRYGKIVSMASESGRANEKRIVVYGATKGGVISLTRGMAAELGRHSINVNAVCPGVTHTPMTSYLTEEIERASERHYPLGRLGRPEDIAPLVTFLASDEASWITGQAISVSGGFGRS